MRWNAQADADLSILSWPDFQAKYPDCSRSAWRNAMSRVGLSIPLHTQRFTAAPRRSRATAAPVTIAFDEESLFTAIRDSGRKGVSLDQLAQSFGVARTAVVNLAVSLSMSGKPVSFSDGVVRAGFVPELETPLLVAPQESSLRFGVISDTHFGSHGENPEALAAMYEMFRQRGITTVFHCGDLDHGQYVYRGCEFEVKVSGLRHHIDNIVENYPKVDGITTYFIEGNHDEDWYKRCGELIGVSVGHARKDLVYLGQYAADIDYGPLRITLLHGKGSPGGWRRHCRTVLDNLRHTANRVPHFLFAGHWHQWGSDTTASPTLIYQAGAFETKQNGLLRAWGIQPVVGGWIFDDVQVDQDRDIVISHRPEFRRLA